MVKNIKNKKSNNKIPFKNYVYATLILVGGILLTIYFFSWYQIKKEEKLMTSYLLTTKTVESSIDSLEALHQILEESPSSYFIYLSYTNDEQVYNFEKSLKRIIDKYKINDVFYYVNLNTLKEQNENYLEEIKKNLKLNKLNRLPALIYVNDGKIVDTNIVDGINRQIITIDDVEKLLKIYDFKIIK